MEEPKNERMKLKMVNEELNGGIDKWKNRRMKE